jgi:hypothetical protein
MVFGRTHTAGIALERYSGSAGILKSDIRLHRAETAPLGIF